MERAEDTKPRIPDGETEADKHAAIKHGFGEAEIPVATYKVQHPNEFIRASGVTEPRCEVKAEHQSEAEHSLSDAEEAWVDDECSRSRKARLKSTKGRKRGASPKARSRSPRRKKVHTIDQLEEVLSTCVPKIERVEGDFHLHLSLYPVTHIHGGYQAGAAPTATVLPHVNNVTVINSTTHPCATSQHGSEADEGSCYLFRTGNEYSCTLSHR